MPQISVVNNERCSFIKVRQFILSKSLKSLTSAPLPRSKICIFFIETRFLRTAWPGHCSHAFAWWSCFPFPFVFSFPLFSWPSFFFSCLRNMLPSHQIQGPASQVTLLQAAKNYSLFCNHFESLAPSMIFLVSTLQLVWVCMWVCVGCTTFYISSQYNPLPFGNKSKDESVWFHVVFYQLPRDLLCLLNVHSKLICQGCTIHTYLYGSAVSFFFFFKKWGKEMCPPLLDCGVVLFLSVWRPWCHQVYGA